MSVPLLYALHSGNLYGTERMALATAEGLTDTFEPIIMAPAGPALEEAAKLGFSTRAFTDTRDFAMQARGVLANHKQLAFMATGVVHSLALIAWNMLYQRRVAHLHIVHGGTDERLSYGRKRWLNHFDVRFVAVSTFVRERLAVHGVAVANTAVVENFLPDLRVADAPRRIPFQAPGLHKVLVVSRIDPIKRIDVLLDALDREPKLRDIEFRLLGTGWEFDTLKQRAADTHPNVKFEGFSADVAHAMTDADLLVHLCPFEPFGLAILEAMAAAVPVLVPDSGGAGSLVEDGVSGFQFKANDADDLARTLVSLMETDGRRFNDVVAQADVALRTRFSAARGIAGYRKLLGSTDD
jgi:glycosyltransferase involved in cell wall biosynthesis